MSDFVVVVVGAGTIAGPWLSNLVGRADVSIAGFVDVDLASAVRVRDEWVVSAQVFAGVKQAIDQTGANLVVNLTPPEAHRAVVGQALELGCDVFGEKPMAASLTDAVALVKMAEETGRTYSVMQNRRYVGGSRSLRHAIASEYLGPTRFVCIDYFMAPHFGGFRHEMPSPLLLDMGIHTFDQLRFLTGAEILTVQCQEFSPSRSRFVGSASALCTFQLSDGSLCSYRGSWDAPGCATSWESSWRIVGERGTALWDGYGMPYMEFIARESAPDRLLPLVERDYLPTVWHGREGHDGCIDAMFAALRRGEPSETDCRDNLRSLAAVFAALASSRERRVVTLDEIVEQAVAETEA